MLPNTRLIITAIGLAAGVLLLSGNGRPASAQTGTWTALANPFPGNGGTANPALPMALGPGTALLLTDGSVIMHDTCTPSWFRLLPAKTGTFANSYINGQWSATGIGDNAPVAPMIGVGNAPDNYGPLYFASAVLPDGRVIVNGGEGENSTGVCGTGPATRADSTKGSLFDPNANSWTSVTPPPGWATIGDADSVVLGPNNISGVYSPANYMLMNCCDGGAAGSQQAVATIAARPSTAVTWTITGTGKAQPNNEENWTLLSTEQVLTINTSPCASAPGVCAPTTAERFDPSQNAWVSAGNTPATLVSQNPRSEMGPQIGIGYNMVVAFGAVNAIALYGFPNNWIAQTSFPVANQGIADGPGSLLPNGNILVQTSNGFNSPSTFWEFNSSILTPQNTGPAAPTQTVNQPQCNSGAPNTTNVAAFQGRMVLIPTGQILWDANPGCAAVYQTTTVGNPNPVMRPPPHINSISSTSITRGTNGYTLTGSMFRGVSQGAAYGDDAQSATNFPLVRITNDATGNRCFARTHDWAIRISTQFDVPPAVTPAPGWALVQRACDVGPSTLVVIVNGLISNGIAVTMN
jgi:hypothetical protein